ncbi:MAG: InlB B-repeat-containing protein [Christensenellaceae bacterium]
MKKKLILILSVLIVFMTLPVVAEAAYEITLSVEPENTGTVEGGGTYEDGENATLVATPAAGYAFMGWYNINDMENPVSTSAEYVYDLEASRTYVAKFARKYSVQTDSVPSDGGSTTGAGQFLPGESVTINAQPSPGFIFSGWFLEGTTNAVSTQPSYTFTVGEQDVRFTANFTANYNLGISIDPVEGGTAIGSGQYSGGSVVNVEAIPHESYRFIGWFDETNLSNALSTEQNWSLNLDEDRVIVAKFDRSYGYTLTRVFIVVAIGVAAAVGVFILVRRTSTIRRRRNYGRRR